MTRETATTVLPAAGPQRHTVAGLLVGGIALLAGLVAGVLVAAAVNPGYERHWYYLKAALPVLVIAAAVAYGAAWLLGATRAAAVAGALVVTGGTIAVVFALGFAARPDRHADVQRNLAFLHAIDRYPGSTVVRTETYRIYPDGDMFAEGFLNPSPGYSTTMTFLLPASATKQSAVDHYRRAFARHGWSTTVSDDCSGDDVVYEVCGQKVIEAYDRDGDYVEAAAVYRRRADGRLLVDL